jgi:hypothetical protein
MLITFLFSLVSAAWCTSLQALALLSGAAVEVVTLDWQHLAVQTRKSLCSAAGDIAIDASWCTHARDGASFLAAIWPTELAIWAASAQQRNIRADKLLEISLTNMSALPQRVSWFEWAAARDSMLQPATLAIWSAEGVHLDTLASADSSCSVRQFTSPVSIAPPTPGRRVCGAWSPNARCLAICSGGEVAVMCLPNVEAVGRCSATPIHKALCVEAAMNAQQQQQQIVLGPMRAIVAAGNGCFVGTTSGGMNLGTTASSSTQMQLNSSSSSSSSTTNDSLLSMLAQSTQSTNSIASLQMPSLQASSSSSGSGGITDLSISVAHSNTVIGISSSTSDDSFLRILSPSHAVNKSAADSFAAASSTQPDRRARLVLVQTTTAATVAATTDAAAALRVTVPTSVPLPLELATPDLLACSSDGAWTVVGSHACSRLQCYNSTSTTSSTGTAAAALTAVLTLQLPEAARPRGVLVVPKQQRSGSSSSSKKCYEVWVLAAWPASSTTTSVKAGSGYMLYNTQLLIFDLPAVAAVSDNTSDKQHTAQESVPTATAAVVCTASGSGSSSSASTAASTVAEVAQLLHAFEQRLNTRLDALCAVVEQQGKQLSALEQRLQAQNNAL